MKINDITKIVRSIYKPATILAVATLIIYVFSGRITAISNSIQEGRTAAALLEKRLAFISELQQDLEILGEENYEKIESALPVPEDILDIITVLDREASRIGIKMNMNIGQISSIQEMYKGTMLGTVDYSMSLTGSVSLINRYLESIYTMPYFSSIENLSIRSQSETSGWNNPNALASLGGKIYIKQIPQ